MSSEKHEETAKHKKLEKEVKNNSALNTDNGRVKLLLPQPVSLEEKVTRAEIIQAFHVVNANLPFLSADTDAVPDAVSGFGNCKTLSTIAFETRICH